MIKLVAIIGIIVVFILARIGSQLYRKATADGPLAAYDKMWKFYVFETLMGLFLQVCLLRNDFIFKKNKDKKLQRLHLVVNILIALLYFVVVGVCTSASKSY